MPYFRCESCALRWYSAASETRCAECGNTLGEAQQLRDATPLAQPRGILRPIELRPPLPAADRRLA
jgi:hypothetical protein